MTEPSGWGVGPLAPQMPEPHALGGLPAATLAQLLDVLRRFPAIR